MCVLLRSEDAGCETPADKWGVIVERKKNSESLCGARVMLLSYEMLVCLRNQC